MGTKVEHSTFTLEDQQAFGDKLRACLQALRSLLARPGFGLGDATLGAELELYLIDAAQGPACANHEVLQHLADPLFSYELNQFNVELNAPYGALAGRPFTHLEEQIDAALLRLRAAGSPLGVRAMPIGILPTLELRDLDPKVMTDLPRYRALDAALRARRASEFQLRINGPEPIDLHMPHVTPEGAATSWQLHLRVRPDEYRDTYNAAQLIAAPLLAVAGNSPFFLGRRLWHETRVALFKKAVDSRSDASDPDRAHSPSRVAFGSDWLTGGIEELFEREIDEHEPLLPECHAQDPMAAIAAGEIPGLHELRLHNSTVWTWNRPVYDPADGAHVRIELRALPAGPTVRDMLANSALCLGLVYAMRSRAPESLLPFDLAHSGFYRAAQDGLDAKLWWPDADGKPVQRVARELVGSLLPLAQEGLLEAGIDRDECTHYLAPIHGRLQNGQTGAAWQLEYTRRHELHGDRKQVLSDMVARYYQLSCTRQAVHTWPLDPLGPLGPEQNN